MIRWRHAGVVALAVLAAVLAACASSTTRRADVPVRAVDFRPNQIRQPVVFARISFGIGQFSDEELAESAKRLAKRLVEE